MNEHARRELEPPTETLSRGSLGPDVRRLQEWLCLNSHYTAVDGDFGPATEAAVGAFAWHYGDAREPPNDRIVGSTTWTFITNLLLDAVRWKPHALGDAQNIVDCASAHLAAHPREVGKPNGGPWVRYYCRGQEVPWCAGFATTVLSQALGHDEWFTLSCDELAAKAHARGLLTVQPPREWQTPEHIKPGDLFLIRRTERWPHDWIHCGIVTSVGDGYFETIEGNTNTDGSREGTAVHARTRAFNERTDFVLTGGER